MADVAVPRGVLLNLAVEGVVPVLGGCAGALVAGPAGGVVGAAVGQVAERAINYFGKGIVLKWAQWFQGQPPAVHQAALAELAALPADQARATIAKALKEKAPTADRADCGRAADYLAAIPRAVERSLVTVTTTGGLTLPPTLSAKDPQALLQLLPTDVPPYPAPSTLPSTDYKLDELIGTGGFGAVYRASSSSLQFLPLAIKFCLDPTLLPALRQERDNLKRLMKAGGESWSRRIVRLYGYNLEHSTPFLVYEYVSGGDLVHRLAASQARRGRAMNPTEVLQMIAQVAEALAFAHQQGLVHRDLKPANVLIGDKMTLMLADFGIGAVMAPQAAKGSRIGTVAVNQLGLDEQVSLYRGAGTPLYMSQEQRRGDAPDPRHDLYSLGVMWYQLLVGDVTRELHPGWARELEAQFKVPRAQIELIQKCVGWIKERPKDAAELLREVRLLLTSSKKAEDPEVVEPLVVRPVEPPPMPKPSTIRPKTEEMAKRVPPLPTVTSPSTPESERARHIRLVAVMRQLLRCQEMAAKLQGLSRPAVQAILLAGVVGGVLGAAFYSFAHEPGALVFGLGLGVAAFGFRLRLRHQAREKAARDVEAKINELLLEFPEECQSWGGIASLRYPEVVKELLADLEPRRARARRAR